MKHVLLLFLFVLSACTSPRPDPHSLEAMKQAERTRLFNQCFSKHVDGYLELIRMGIDIYPPPSDLCWQWANQMVR